MVILHRKIENIIEGNVCIPFLENRSDTRHNTHAFRHTKSVVDLPHPLFQRHAEFFNHLHPPIPSVGTHDVPFEQALPVLSLRVPLFTLRFKFTGLPFISSLTVAHLGCVHPFSCHA